MVAGADDEEDTAKVFQEPFEHLGYSPEELAQFTRYVKIYVEEQRKHYESILNTLPTVTKWHMREENQQGSKVVSDVSNRRTMNFKRARLLQALVKSFTRATSKMSVKLSFLRGTFEWEVCANR